MLPVRDEWPVPRFEWRGGLGNGLLSEEDRSLSARIRLYDDPRLAGGGGSPLASGGKLQPRPPPGEAPARSATDVAPGTPGRSARAVEPSAEPSGDPQSQTVPSPVRLSDLRWQGKFDPEDLKFAEVVNYQWQVVRSQMADVKAELKELRKEVEDLNVKNKRLTDSKDQLGSTVEELRTEAREDRRHFSAEVERLRREVEDRHASLDEKVKAALQDTQALMRKELGSLEEEQRKLSDTCAKRETVEEDQASLRKELMSVSKEDQSRYSQFGELVRLHLQELEDKLNRERAKLEEDNKELAKKLEDAVSDADHSRRTDLARLSSEHHTRHDDLNSSLQATSEELRKKIADEIGKCFDAHYKDYEGLKKKLDSSLKELDAKLAHVEAKGEEVLFKVRAAGRPLR